MRGWGCFHAYGTRDEVWLDFDRHAGQVVILSGAVQAYAPILYCRRIGVP
jgi:hypothetical protein